MRIIFIVFVACLLSGCAIVTTDRITTSDTQGRFHEGMSFNEVKDIVGRPPSSMSDIYKSETLDGHVYVTWEINGRVANSDPNGYAMYRIYEFKFKDDKLASWSWRK